MKTKRASTILVLALGLGLAGNASGQLPEESRLVAYWNFDEGEGTIVHDSSGSENHGTLVGDPQWAEGLSNLGWALDFDGDGDYIVLEDARGLDFAPGSFSVSAWINPRQVEGGWRAIFEYDRYVFGGSNWFGIWLNHAGGFHFRIGLSTLDSEQKIAPNEWHLVTATYDSTEQTMRVYIDAQLDNAFVIEKPDHYFSSPTVSKLTIGAWGLEDGEYFDGKIDDVRIYNRTLSGADVVELFEFRSSEPGDMLSGCVYAGEVEDQNVPLSGVTVELYCSNNSDVLGTLTAGTTTDKDGWFELPVAGGWEFYNIVETDLEGYGSAGALSIDGRVINSNWIQYEYPLEGKMLAGNRFWDLPSSGGMPDLVVTDVWNEDSIICYQIRNVGGAAAPGGHHTALFIDDEYEAGQLVDMDLEPGERWNGCFEYIWDCTAAEDNIVVVADYENIAAEGNETNNFREETWKCDTAPPKIVFGPLVQEVTRGSAVILWETDEDSDSIVKYGKMAGLFDLESAGWQPVRTHSVILTRLEPSTTYHFIVQSTDLSNNTVESKDITFETLLLPDNQGPTVSLIDPGTVQGVVTLSADADDDTGVARVEFFIDGELAFIDYSAPYESYLDTSQYENGEYDLSGKAFDFYGNSYADNQAIGILNLKDDTAPWVTIISPTSGAIVSGTIDVEASLLSDVAGLRAATIGVDAYIKGGKEWAPPYPTAATVKFSLDTTELDNGKRIIAVWATDKEWKSDLATVKVDVYNEPPPPPPKLTVVGHKATRNQNYFTISLTVKNAGGDEARNIVIRDNLLFFQAISDDTSVAEYTAEILSYLKGSDCVITSKVNIPAGQSQTYIYNAVPVMVQSETPNPMIGNSIDLSWTSASPGVLTDWVQAPAYQTTSGELIIKAYENALKASDYLIVTSPKNLLRINPAADVHKLLSTMAELAKLKSGSLGFLDVPVSMSRDYEPDDGFACGDAVAKLIVKGLKATKSDTKLEVVIGDRDLDKIFAYGLAANGWAKYGEFEPATSDSGGFEQGDRIAVCQLFSGYVQDQIVMGDASADRIYAYFLYGAVVSEVIVDFEAFDGLATGDVTGDGCAEIVMADRSANKIYIFTRSTTQPNKLVKLGEFPADYDMEDGFAVGDVMGDGKAEIVIADKSTWKIRIFSANSSLLKEFPCFFGDWCGLTLGDVGWNAQDPATWDFIIKEEIIIAVKPAVTPSYIEIYNSSGKKLKTMNVDFDDGYGLATGDVAGTGQDQILVADWEGDAIYVYEGTGGSSDPFVLYDLIKEGSTGLGYESESPWGEWSSKLKDDWTYNGYLLIVGETEIVPAWGGLNFGTIKTSTGDLTLKVDTTDSSYASTWAYKTRPELSIGRIIGNNAKELRKPIETSINVAKKEPGYEFSRSNAIGIAGYRKGLGGGGADIDFKTEVLYVVKALQNKGVSTATLFTPDYTAYDPQGAIDENATKGLLKSLFYNAINEKDVIHLAAHGNAGSWDTIGLGDIWNKGNLVGHKRPFVYANSCLTGRYTAGLSMAEAFLQTGAAVYFGATEVGLCPTEAYMAKMAYEKWDAGEPVGLAIKQMKQSTYGKKENYLKAVYHLFGDPKYGAEGPPSGASAFQGIAQQPETPSSVELIVPDYEVGSVDGADYPVIPGGYILSVSGKPLVPYYRVFYQYPKGYQIQDITLTSISEPVIAFGLNIPNTIFAIPGSGLTAAQMQQPGEQEGWPKKSFEWSVFEEPDSIILAITVFPFHYNPLTRESRFYQSYDFDIDYTISTTEITILETDKPVYQVGEEVAVEVEFNDGEGGEIPPEGKDVVVATYIRKEGSEEVIRGPFLRTIKGLRGRAALSSIWDSSGVKPGYYYAEVVLKDTEGTLLAKRTEMFRLGICSGEITDFTATPEYVQIGDDVTVNMTFSNTGTVNVTGSARIKIMNATGDLINEFEHPIADLLPSQSVGFTDIWNVSEDGLCHILGYVLYDSKATEPVTAKINSCWSYPRQCHGDADGKSQGKQKYWVSTNDLDILIAAWNKPLAEIEGKTLYSVDLICADFNHLPQGKSKYRVSTDDLDILIANWQIPNGPDPDCP